MFVSGFNKRNVFFIQFRLVILYKMKAVYYDSGCYYCQSRSILSNLTLRRRKKILLNYNILRNRKKENDILWYDVLYISQSSIRKQEDALCLVKKMCKCVTCSQR